MRLKVYFPHHLKLQGIVSVEMKKTSKNMLYYFQYRNKVNHPQ
jgi:hypothetical protein